MYVSLLSEQDKSKTLLIKYILTVIVCTLAVMVSLLSCSSLVLQQMHSLLIILPNPLRIILIIIFQPLSEDAPGLLVHIFLMLPTLLLSMVLPWMMSLRTCPPPIQYQ